MAIKVVTFNDAEGNAILPKGGVIEYPYTSENGKTRLYPLPRVYWSAIDPTHTLSIYLKELIKWICAHFPEAPAQSCWYGMANPNSAGLCMIHIYDVNTVDSNGYPQYTTGLYTSIVGDLYSFGFNNYNWYFYYFTKA